MNNTISEEKKAVDTGYWHLWRYNPELKEEGKTLSDVADTSAYDQILFMYDCDQFADETNFDLLK